VCSLELRLQFLSNYLGHFALVNSLCDIVRDRSGRIAILGSGAGVDQIPGEVVMFANSDGCQFYDSSLFYEQSKFAVAAHPLLDHPALAERLCEMSERMLARHAHQCYGGSSGFLERPSGLLHGA
jgi:NAD(P)-dependent dehydrogenase (short-subunit alcohol dehydrogenase family)